MTQSVPSAVRNTETVSACSGLVKACNSRICWPTAINAGNSWEYWQAGPNQSAAEALPLQLRAFAMRLYRAALYVEAV